MYVFAMKKSSCLETDFYPYWVAIMYYSLTAHRKYKLQNSPFI